MNSITGVRDVARTSGAPDGILCLRGVTKRFGPTKANRNLTFDIPRGGIVGLVGANGAGKSTLVKILSGSLAPDDGVIEFDGARIDLSNFDARRASEMGIRIVHQELSLSTNLSVLENFYLENPTAAGAARWRAALAKDASGAIEAIFPGARINPHTKVAELSLAQRQMVEIAKAASDPKLKVLIFDEPTSALDSNRSRDLVRYMQRRAALETTFIFITHRLREVISAASSIIVMRNGDLIWQGHVAETSVDNLVSLMGGGTAGNLDAAVALRPSGRTPSDALGPVFVTIAADSPVNGLGTPIEIRAGEVVGLAGLEGSGQRDFLKLVYRRSGRSAAFVAGDRAQEGIFPESSVRFNAIIGLIAHLGLTHLWSAGDETVRIEPWFYRLRITKDRESASILELSGGTQQKVLMARALLLDARLVLLDDPTRGVDVGVKTELYEIVRSMAAEGRAFFWYSSEDLEFLQCSRVIVFNNGRATKELSGPLINESEIVTAAFSGEVPRKTSKTITSSRIRSAIVNYLSLITLATVVCALGFLNPHTLSVFGIELLLSAAVPVIFVALAQMFIVGGSQIDLGVGAFAGMTSVISATYLVAKPPFGIAILAATVLAYVLIAIIIEACSVPAIVVTLGASFIWLGIGYTIQLIPGGSSPEWLTSIFSAQLFFLPAPVIIIATATVAAVLINTSRFGVVLRAVGNNRRALLVLGWPLRRYQMGRYALASLFGICAGLSLTAINTASDINSGGSFTLLSVASIVVGGSMLEGGWIWPLRTTCGAITLSLVGNILGLLNVSSDYFPMVQGGLLILILLTVSLLKDPAE